MRLTILMIILLTAAFTVFGNNINDLYLKAGSRGIALAIEMENNNKVVFNSRGIKNGFEVAIKNSASNLSLTKFTDFGSNSPLKSISFIKKNGNILVKGILPNGSSSSPSSKWSGSKILILINKNSYPEMSWRASEYDYNDNEDASFAVSDKEEISKIASPKTIQSSPVKPKIVSKPVAEPKAIDTPVSKVVPEIEEESASGMVETTKGGINFRSSPNSATRENIVAVLEKGVRAELVSKSGSWLKVKTEKSGKVGWLHNSLVAEVTGEDESENEVEIADAKAIPKENLEVAPVKEIKPGSSKPNIKKYREFGRDPFLPLDKCDFLLPDLPNVEEATLVGIIYDNMDRIALIEYMGKKGIESYTLRENSTVFNGRVLKIRESEVVFLISEAMYSRQYVLKMKEKIEE